MGGAEDRIHAKFVATPLVNLPSYAYVMKQAVTKKAALGGRNSDAAETLLFWEKTKF